MRGTAPYPQSCLTTHCRAADSDARPPAPIYSWVTQCPKHLGQSSRFVVFHKPPLQNSSEFKWWVLDYLSLLPFGYLPVIVNPIWGEYNHTSNNAFAFLPIFPTTMRTGCLSPATISTTGRSSHDGGTLHALSSYLPPDLETQR